MIKIGIILGSARKHSLGDAIFTYLHQQNPDTAEVSYHWLKVGDYDLAPYQHEATPLSQPIQNLAANEQRWLADLAELDGYLILSPEYDHALPGVLKNALDYVGPEVRRKPVLITTYSSYSDGGVLAAASMVGILQMLKMIVLPTPVLLWNGNDTFAEDGTLKDSANRQHFASRLSAALSELQFYSRVLKANPYPHQTNSN